MSLCLILLPTLVLLVTLLVILYLFSSRKYNHWKDKNVPFIPPVPVFGNAFKLLLLRESLGDFCRSMYERTKGPFVGFFVCDEPYLLVRDPELIKNILVKNFHLWNDRSIYDNVRDDPMGSHILFILKNPDWKDIRRKMSPVFTTGKMRGMFKFLRKSGDDLIEFLKEEVEKHSVIDIRDASTKYTTDSLTSSVMGLEANSFKSEDSEFRAISKRVFNWSNWERVISMSAYFVAPNLVDFFKLRFVDKKSTDFLREVFWRAMNERREKKIVRDDLLDILIEILDKEQIDDPTKLEGDKLVAQATQFFIAGSETTTTTISFALYELAANEDVQSKLRSEIREVLSKHKELSFDALKEMEYLDMCIKETLRKYPVLPFLDRRCSADYQIPGTDVILEKGSPIFIPVWGLHYDPLYFPDPDVFDPLRFTDDNIQSRHPFCYLPFGDGPRHCIGERFGLMSSKICVAKIILEFQVRLVNKIKLDHKGILVTPVDGVYLDFGKI